MFFNKNNYAIGIDVGSHFIKIVRLVYNNDKIGIDRYIIQKTPRQLLDNGIVQFPEDLGRILDTIFIEHDIKCKSASVSLPIRNETVLLKWIELPNLKEKEMEKALGSMIEDEFRIPANNLYFNWTKIKEDRYDGKETAQVLLVGAIKEGVDNMVAVLKEAKIKPYHLEGDIFSLMRGVGQEVIDKNIAIIDIGFNQTAISMFSNKHLKYSRYISNGGAEWIKKVIDELGFDEKSAEEELFENGCVSVDGEGLDFQQQAFSDVLSNAIDLSLDEIGNTIDFYEDRYNNNIDEIILTGGGARLKGIDTYIESRLGIPTIISKPYFVKNLSLQEREELEPLWPSLMVAIGLALKEVSDNV